ncbi:MAG: mercury transporter [Bauldia sp.]|nr:MAG: mercury transporter [Bauldia sp.]MBZ0228801.1 mercury transporter [Bauldia sp.]
MIHRIISTCLSVFMLAGAAAQAAEKTIVLKVANATCALCGPIVKGTLERVAGVTAVTVEEADGFPGAVATVRFDDETTDVAALIAATTNAGYPSQLER